MAEETAVIEQQMEERRQALAEKVEALGQQVVSTVKETTEAVSDTVESVTGAVQETVGTVSDTVQKTVETVKDTFNFSKQIEQHPWLAVGGAAVVGYLAGALLFPRSSARSSESSRLQEVDEVMEEPREASQQGVPCPSETECAEASGGTQQETQLTFGGLLPVLGRLREMAIGTTTGVIGEMVRAAVPEMLRDEVTKVVDRFTTSLGGKPIHRT